MPVSKAKLSDKEKWRISLKNGVYGFIGIFAVCFGFLSLIRFPTEYLHYVQASVFIASFFFLGLFCSTRMILAERDLKTVSVMTAVVLFSMPGIYSIISSYFINSQQHYGFAVAGAFLGGIIYIIITIPLGVFVSIKITNAYK